MKTILVPFDFSRAAKNAFRYAVDIAMKSKGTVHLLHVIELPVINDTVTMPIVTFERGFFKELREKTNKEFDKFLSKVKPEVKVVMNVEFGPVGKMINTFVAKNPIDLIVMGSHGASGLREMIIGSNAEKVVRNSPIPVLVIKDYNKRPVRNIVLPNTLEMQKTQEFTTQVKALQSFFKAKLHIVYINTPANFTSDTTTLERLKEFAKQSEFKNFTLNIFNHQAEEEGIIEFTRSVKGDMIAIGTRGRKGIAHLIDGSLAENVVNHAMYPMWTYHLKPQSATHKK